jgi:hypothetical protein
LLCENFLIVKSKSRSPERSTISMRTCSGLIMNGMFDRSILAHRRKEAPAGCPGDHHTVAESRETPSGNDFLRERENLKVKMRPNGLNFQSSHLQMPEIMTGV